MAYSNETFAATGNGLNLYKTTDNKAAVKGANYFNKASDKVLVGDWILVSASDGALIAKVKTVTRTSVVIETSELVMA